MAILPGIPNIRIGHATNTTARTGCTVILCPTGATAGADVRGAAPGTRETDLLRPGNLVDRVHAILLTGGSAFGLSAADGVMRWLHERGYGFPTRSINVPIVPAAVLFDLAVGEVAWPDASMGYAACEAAQTHTLDWGQVGAGTGATVGKVLGQDHAVAGGIGTASMTLPDGSIVAAVVAVNAFGHVIDSRTQRILAGSQTAEGVFVDTVDVMLARSTNPAFSAGENTTIGCIITTGRLDKAGCLRVANMAHDGLARTIRPVHTQFDGDTLFALSSPPADVAMANINLIGIAAAEVVAQAVVHAVSPIERSA